MLLKSLQRWARGVNFEQPGAHPGSEVDVNRAHVANDLLGRLLIGKEHRPFATLAGGFDKFGGNAAFAGAGRAGNQHAAATIDTLATQHFVQARYPGQHALGGNLVVEQQRGDRQHGETVRADQEVIFVHPVGGAAIFQHTQSAG